VITAIVILSLLAVFLFISVVVILARYIPLVRQLRADRDYWSTSYEDLQERMQPIIDYLMYCQKTGQEMNASSCRAYFYGIGQDYDYWIAQWINQQQLQAYK
jgi:hypothetical protein